MSKKQTFVIHKGISIPIDLVVEKRNGWRASIRKDKVIIRLPKSRNMSLVKSCYDDANQWLLTKLEKDPEILERFKKKNYDKAAIEVMGNNYQIEITEVERKTGKIVINKGRIKLTLPINLNISIKNKMIRKLIARGFSKLYKSNIENEVFLINEKYFQKKINSIKLKYNTSNWGSCSTKSNINLSSRLLLVPRLVREYVIIHELSHLTHMNHSKQFWNLVESICPDYKKHELWLKKEGGNIDF